MVQNLNIPQNQNHLVNTGKTDDPIFRAEEKFKRVFRVFSSLNVIMKIKTISSAQ